MAVGVEVDCGYHGNKLPIEFFLPNLHYSVEVFYGNHEMRGRYIIHGFYFLSKYFVDGNLIRLQSINVPFMQNEIDLSSYNVCQLVQPLGVDRIVETLYVAPFRLFIFFVSLCVPEAYTHDVVFAKTILDVLHNGQLWFILR